MSADFISNTGIKLYDHAAERGIYHLVDEDAGWTIDIPVSALAAIDEYLELAEDADADD